MWSESRRCAGAAALFALALAASEPLYAQQLPDPEQDQAEPASGPRGVLRLFGAVEWGATNLPDTPNSFALGQLDLFLTAALTERTTVLVEVVLEEST